MAKEGLIALSCAATLAAASIFSPVAAAPGDDADNLVASTLAVQTALQQGRAQLLKGDSKAAVHTLESQLSRINGNSVYLALLRDAYRAHIKDLRLAGLEAEAQRYSQRLQILDPGAVLDGSLGRSANAPAPPPAAPKTVIPVKNEPAPPTARGKIEEDDDPFRPEREDKHGKARSLLARAESAFGAKRFKEAGAFFEQAHQADAGCTAASLDRWAYCKLHRVVEQLNQPAAVGTPAWADLESETKQALSMAPKLEYAKQLLAEIDKRKAATAPAPAPKETAAAKVKHTERDAGGWACAETANFRIYHTQPREVAEKAAQAAERTRTTISARWFGGFKDDWSPRCDIYLHASAQDYSQATGVPANSPGHSTIRNDAGRVVGRRIDLHCDDANSMLIAVLPHETTHVVIAGQFGDQQIPRWADEGMAVLTEPRDRVDRHLRNLPNCRRDNALFTMKQLVTMPDYPEPRYITAFYAQSVSLVEFLALEKSHATFTAFLREAVQVGYEKSLEKHYGFKSFDELQQKWQQKTFAADVAQQR